MLDVDQTPESPGLYAWYATFQASNQDWKFKPDGASDGAILGFLNLLRRYASYYEPLPIDLAGRGAYGSRWEGLLEIDFPLRPEESESTDEDRLGVLLDTLGSEDRRRVMATLLKAATPVFSSPLYIGVAENLQNRLKQHKRDFEQADEWLRDHPEDAQVIKLRGKSFGQRAAARGISMNNLEVWVIHLEENDQNGVTVKEVRKTAESTEWLLHRLYSPILGKQ
ncbi:GIY-YIG nuclease family protein [Actinomadura madurae]|uniref:GIY-YIG nuclease family protein n=1 Tax=Actinomadura madurae TaxID=1993 RepID=UPI002027259F|nr:GIY-YIG nuclease family protein [Actinomadura madurae]URN08546.1 GIY-YIG nuclease family protein [Actinomadura madurae]